MLQIFLIFFMSSFEFEFLNLACFLASSNEDLEVQSVVLQEIKPPLQSFGGDAFDPLGLLGGGSEVFGGHVDIWM